MSKLRGRIIFTSLLRTMLLPLLEFSLTVEEHYKQRDDGDKIITSATAQVMRPDGEACISKRFS